MEQQTQEQETKTVFGLERTEDFLKRYEESIENFIPEDWQGETKEQYKENYERLKQIYETITPKELQFLFYLRYGDGKYSEMVNYLLPIAKENFTANQKHFRCMDSMKIILTLM